jgi:mRNA-degrading endonuclease RelE of RelBE toxin-antitoxin system
MRNGHPAAPCRTDEKPRIDLLNTYNFQMNSIQWKPKAVRQLLRLDRQAQAQIRDDVGAKLTSIPFGSSVKALTNHVHGYRLRVGNYRVLFDFEGGAACIVSIEEVRKRDERTY